MYVGQAVTYPSEALFRFFTLWQAPGLAHKHYIRMERLDRDKHSSLLQKFVNYKQKKVYNIGPRGGFFKISHINLTIILKIRVH
jgi:hypothetical protein